MKTLLLALIVAVFVVAPARAESFDAAADQTLRDVRALHNELDATKLQLDVAKAAAKDAELKNDEQNAAWQAKLDGLLKRIADLEGILNLWYVRLVLWCAKWIWRLTLGFGSLYLLAFIGGKFFPASSFMFGLARELVIGLPISQVVDRWLPTAWVKTKTLVDLSGRNSTPSVVDAASAAPRPSDDPALRARVDALAAADAPAPPTASAAAQATASAPVLPFFAVRTVGEILQGVRREVRL